MASPSNCPSDARFRELLAGNLSEDEQAELAGHLEECAACRQRLETLAGGDDLPLGIAGHSADDPPTSDLAGLVERLKAEGPESSQPTMPSAPNHPALHFLQPSDNPRHLGRLGSYEILEVIGRGGMGIVLKARDAKLERLVAVKVLSPELACSGPARARFLREARSAAAVTHEHVVTIHAVEDAAEVPFLVMEYIVGVSLEDRIQRTGHLRVEEVLRIGMQAAQGLAAAHAQGLVHRDIKPANILLENGVERVKLTDFGLARVVHEAQVTQSNLVAGTPQYMSPEQARGEPVDHRSDLFSLGCVLYAMCVGRSPFRADTPTGAIHRVCSDTPRPIRELNPDIPDWLAAIIDRLLAKKPDDRFQTAGEVAEVLGEYLAHVQQPSRVRLPPSPPRPRTGDSRLRRLSVAAVVLLGIAVVGLIGFALSLSKKEPEPRFFSVSLTPYANRDRAQPVHPGDMRNNLALVPPTLQVEGAPYVIPPRYIQLAGEERPGWPTQVTGIAVNKKASKLHFLHGCGGALPLFGGRAATYTLHYDDGTSAELPVITGRHLVEWWVPSDYVVLRATRATTAWVGSNPPATENGRRLMLWACCAKNPHPEKTIATIDFQRGLMKKAYPFCLAITCDQDSTPLPQEPGLLRLYLDTNTQDYSAAIAGPSGGTIAGSGRHDVLLPPGRYSVELRDCGTVIRRGSVKIEAGSLVELSFNAPQALFPLPTPDPEPLDELVGQTDGIWDVALSHDARTLATAAGDGTVVLRRREGGVWKRRSSLTVSDFRVRSVAFSPNGKLLAIACERGTLAICDVVSGQVVATLHGDGISVSAVTFLPDGKTLVCGNGDGTVEVWDADSYERLTSFKAHQEAIHDLAFSPDGTVLASGAWEDSAVKLWDVGSWQRRHVMLGHTGGVVSLAFSPDGKTLASASYDTTVRLWDVETGESRKCFRHPGSLLSVAFAPDGKTVAAGGGLQAVRIWDVASETVTHDFHANWGQVRSLSFSPDGNTLLTSGMDNTARTWAVNKLPGPFAITLAGPEPRATFPVTGLWGACVAFSPGTDNLLAAVGENGADVLRVWELKGPSFVAKAGFGGSGKQFIHNQSLGFLATNGTLVSCVSRVGNPGLAKWDPVNLTQVGAFTLSTLPTETGVVPAKIAVSTDGTAVAVATSVENRISMLDATTGATRWSVQTTVGNLWTVAISADAQTVALGSNPGLIVLLDAATGKEKHEPLRHGTQPVTEVDFSPDGSLTSVSADGSVWLWDMTSFQSVTLPRAHNENCTSVAFSPDGRLLVTTAGPWSSEKTPWKHKGEVCLWDVAARKLVAKFHSHYGSVTCAVFSPDGKQLATTGRDGKMHLWDVAEVLKVAAVPPGDAAPEENAQEPLASPAGAVTGQQ